MNKPKLIVASNEVLERILEWVNQNNEFQVSDLRIGQFEDTYYLTRIHPDNPWSYTSITLDEVIYDKYKLVDESI